MIPTKEKSIMSAKQDENINVKWYYYLVFIIIISAAIYFTYTYKTDDIKYELEKLGYFAPLVLFILRFSSIIIPALPSTAYSVLSGALLGFKQGIIVICLADLCSCSIAFYLSRNFGRKVIKKLIGNRFMERVEKISRKHLENNFFLMTSFLMTGLFDFVCYAIGLTKTPWRKFFPALFLSVIISNPPIVALGSGILQGGKRYLIFGILGAFLLGIVGNRISKKINKSL